MHLDKAWGADGRRCANCGWFAEHEFIAHSDPKIVLYACGDCFERMKRDGRMQLRKVVIAEILEQLNKYQAESKNKPKEE